MAATLQALQVLGALTSIGLRALEASFKLQTLLRQARAENRDISDAELAALKQANETLTREVTALLED